MVSLEISVMRLFRNGSCKFAALTPNVKSIAQDTIASTILRSIKFELLYVILISVWRKQAFLSIAHIMNLPSQLVIQRRYYTFLQFSICSFSWQAATQRPQIHVLLFAC